MPDELETCLAALFLNKGKDVLTVKEFSMYVSLDLRWMQVKDANDLMELLLKRKLLTRSGDYLRPNMDLSSVDVPVAYRPSEDLIKTLKVSEPAARPEPANTSQDIFHELIQKAAEYGMNKGTFISECNKISKRTNVDIEVASLMVLRDKGMDVLPYIDGVRSVILNR